MDKSSISDSQFSTASDTAESNPFQGVWRWLDERLGLHTIQYEVPPHANGILYTLGGVTLLGFLMVGITGFFMTQFYHPHPAEARDSIIYLITRVSFGEFTRGIHFWGANLVVITMSLHILRVFISGSYKRPRELNWVVGVGLFALTMAFFFTGTVLKWDQEAFEALQHQEAIAKLLGGAGTVATTDFTRSVPLLTRLYLVHTSVLAVAFIILMGVHLFLVKYLKISPLPRLHESSQEYAGVASGDEKSYFSTHVKDMVGYGMILHAECSPANAPIPGTHQRPGCSVYYSDGRTPFPREVSQDLATAETA